MEKGMKYENINDLIERNGVKMLKDVDAVKKFSTFMKCL